jgi:anaerobic selenocysteine-containing dehydrogenase
MARTGERGAGAWKSISWDEALEQIAAKVVKLEGAGYPEALAAISGRSTGATAALLKRFVNAFGSNEYFTEPTAFDSYALVVTTMDGPTGTVGFDVKNADFLLSFGSGFLDGWGSPVQMFQANSQWQDNGGKTVQVESRLSNTAAKADEWIAINPGTEATLALGIAHILMSENMVSDASFNGFGTWKAMVMADYAPDKVATETGVTVETIKEIANAFVHAQKPLAICGRGQGQTPVSTFEAMAVHALNHLAGNVNKVGGVMLLPEMAYPWPAVAATPQTAPVPLNKRWNGDKPLEVLLLSGGNPLFTQRDSERVKEALTKAGLIVSFSSYMDETTQFADLILPNHTYLEGYDDVVAGAGVVQAVVGLSRPVVKPLHDTKSTGDVIIALAQKIGGTMADAFQWNDYKDCLKQTYGFRWNKLLVDGYMATGRGASASGPASVLSNSDDAVAKPVPSPPADAADFPLMLIPYDTLRMANGAIGNPPFLTKIAAPSFLDGETQLVEVNPETAKSLGLREGQRVNLSTSVGEAMVKVKLYDGLKPGLVAMPTGLGHWAFDSFLSNKGVNINRLIATVEDPVSGMDVAWGVPAKLAAV